MSENQDQIDDNRRVEPSVGASGYAPEDEGGSYDSYPDESTAGNSTDRQAGRPAPEGKTDEWRRNFNSVFGQGIGRISLITSGVIVLILIAVGVRSLTSTSAKVQSSNNAQVEVPSAPSAPVNINPVTQKEAERRNAASGAEAERAQQTGDSYQPAFMPHIRSNDQLDGEANDIFRQIPTNQVPPENMPVPNASLSGDSERRNMEDARRRQSQAYEDEVRKRDQYVAKQQEMVMGQLDKMLLQDSLNKLGKNTAAAYAPSPANGNSAAASQSTFAVAGQGTAAAPTSRRAPVIRTGNILYAETISEINTDNGSDVLAVIRGGAWDKSKLIGKIETRPNNVGIRFTTLAPQDGRSAMSINAVALRTEDASQGVAENIDHHTLERYMALGASSVLSGFGKAYAQTPGTAVIAPSGTTITTTQEPSSRQVAATTVGELGTNLSQEIQRGFNRPTTYSTPANQGFAVFFLADVVAQN